MLQTKLNKETNTNKPPSGKGFIFAGKICRCILLFQLVAQPLAGSNNYPVGARSRAMSHASVAFSDTWASFNNQAGIADINSITAGFFYESRYSLDELSLCAGTVIFPIHFGSFGLSLYQFGINEFKEQKIALAFAKQLSKRCHAGIQMDYFSYHLPENENPADFSTFEAGIIFRATDKLLLGAHVFNPVLKGYNYPSCTIPALMILRAGGQYAFDEMVLLAFEAEKDTEHPFLLKTGLEFKPVKSLALRMGLSGNPFNYTAGLGYQFSMFSADIAFGYHNNLGITPSVSVQINL